MTFVALLLGALYLADCQVPEPCCCQSPVVYAGGGVGYVDTHFPQHQLVNDPEGYFRNKTASTYLGWQAYGGIEVWCSSQWRLGGEVGYKNLAHFKTAYLAATRDSFSDAIDGQVSLRYLDCTGINLVVKGGAAYVKTRITEEGAPYFLNRQTYYFSNIYPELTLGCGYLITPYLNLVASWSHLFGPNSTSRYLQQTTDAGITLRPAQCPGFDTITLNLEFYLQ